MTTIIGKLTILSTEMAIGPALTPKALRFAKTLGFASVINAMPSTGADLEDANATEMAMLVRQCGMEYRQFSGTGIENIDEAEIAGFKSLINELPKPVFVYSQTGLRATALWAASMTDVMERDEILAAAKRAGQDISAFLNAQTFPMSKVA